MDQNKNCFKSDVKAMERVVFIASILGMISAFGCIVYSLMGLQ